MNTDNNTQSLGIVISRNNTPNPYEFFIQVKHGEFMNINDFVIVPTSKGIILGKISNITMSSEMYSDPKILKFYWDQGRQVEEFYQKDLYKIAQVSVLGVLRNNKIEFASFPVFPGDEVFPAQQNHIASYLSINKDGIKIGTLFSRNDVSLNLDPEKLFPYHFAVLGATGSGKSYTNGVIIEEALLKEVPVLVIDPHGEYCAMGEDIVGNNLFKDLRPKVKILQPPKNNHLEKLDKEKLVERTPITLSLNEIPGEYLAELLQCSETQTDLLSITLHELQKYSDEITIQSLLEGVETIGKRYGFTASPIRAATRRIYRLSHLNILGPTLPVEDIVTESGLSIIDLSGSYDEYTQRIITAIILLKVFNAAKSGKIRPILVVIEESHIFCPQQIETSSKWIIRKIAREGRKFGISLNVTSQRIIGLDKDVLSQCNTKIVLKIDSRTDLDYLIPYLSITSQTEAEAIPRLPQGHVFLTGLAIGSPSIVRIRKRFTRHGGKTPRFVRKKKN